MYAFEQTPLSEWDAKRQTPCAPLILVETSSAVSEFIQAVRSCASTYPDQEIILGVDSEGIRKNKPLSLFQVLTLKSNLHSGIFQRSLLRV